MKNKKFLGCLIFLTGCVAAPISQSTFDNSNLNFQEEQTQNFTNIESNEQDTNEISLEPENEKELSLEEENLQFLNQRLQELEKILQEREQEISLLKQEQKKQEQAKEQEPKNELSQSKEELETKDQLISQAIAQDLEKSFRINNDSLNFKIGENKKSQDDKQTNTIHQQIEAIKKSELVEKDAVKQVLEISLESITPAVLLTPPTNPTLLTRIDGASNFYKKAYNSFSKQNYKQAIKEFHQYIELYSHDNAVDNSFFWIGVSYWHQNELKIAQKYFAYILQNFAFIPTNHGGKTADAMLMLGRFSKDRPNDSKQYYQKILELFPNSNTAKTAKKLLQEIP